MSDIADSIINIEMRERNASNNGWIIEHPLTIGENVSISDADNVFTATTVEGALSELFIYANNGDLGIKNAIVGKGGTVTDANGDGRFTRQELENGVNSIKQGGGNAVETDVVLGKTFTNADGVIRTGNQTSVNPIAGDTYGTPLTSGNSMTTTMSKVTNYIKINYGGSIRIKYGLAKSQSASSAYSQIYKNGSPVGVLRSAQLTTDTIFIEDFICSKNDLFSIWGYSSDGQAYVHNCCIGINTTILPLTQVTY
ncbi:hypothetical protein LL033_17470 [Clostridium estertheticum]|uniref:hypothetical protein n=1 Tax=Clostridium estertheticum TaxID=238834 RepID=UPI001C0E76AB|nr:hypothetical protein [Clostridium estertheticum]MBU3216641.1 hypothetical protein [Clostridium estertheticum]WAG54404.1 hypothetical protein LL033_17470 [Clostridium estertheticum]